MKHLVILAHVSQMLGLLNEDHINGFGIRSSSWKKEVSENKNKNKVIHTTHKEGK